MTAPVFDCNQCGKCCNGTGGIVLAPKDMDRLCAYLGIDVVAFMAEYGYMHNGKAKVRTGADGNCIFFVADKGCSVHEGKPDVCRAWPFFRGNLVDPISFAMAKEYCPGIAAKARHDEFVRQGQQYLHDHGLGAHDAQQEAVALLPCENAGR